MLSVHPDIRNYLGQVFVELRIKYEKQFRKLFPGNHSSDTNELETEQMLRKEWTMRLTAAAKDDLFNMFHNKSDNFLNNVGRGRIRIVGSPTDETWTTFEPFDDNGEPVSFSPNLVVPGIGYQSTLAALTNEQVSIRDFFLGCCHAEHESLFAVGFARPIIGNIPTISEMQANYIVRLLAGKAERQRDVAEVHETDKQKSAQRFSKLNLNAVYPVEMFPYCDRLAKLMSLNIGQSISKSPSNWWRTLASPATTLHYFQDEGNPCTSRRYMPWTLVLFILLMKPVDWLWKLCKSLKA